MPKVAYGARPEAVNQSARHVLFVEGNDERSFDPAVLQTFFQAHRLGSLQVRPLRGSFHVRAAAEALHPGHPTYYFLIDRDHHDDTTVAQLWRDFPDPAKCNLLMWRRKELESYFIIPEYLAKSRWCPKSADEITQVLLKEARRRIWLDLANHVIVAVREDLKKNWIETFDAVTGFETYDKALDQLKRRSEFTKKKKADARTLDPSRIEARLDEACKLFLGGDKLEAGRGHWMERMNGKHLFRQIIPPCFEVRDNAGRKLGGKDKEIAVVEDLLRLPLSEQPRDFQELHRLIAAVMR